jgi:hypothetical protein
LRQLQGLAKQASLQIVGPRAYKDAELGCISFSNRTQVLHSASCSQASAFDAAASTAKRVLDTCNAFSLLLEHVQARKSACNACLFALYPCAAPLHTLLATKSACAMLQDLILQHTINRTALLPIPSSSGLRSQIPDLIQPLRPEPNPARCFCNNPEKITFKFRFHASYLIDLVNIAHNNPQIDRFC